MDIQAELERRVTEAYEKINENAKILGDYVVPLFIPDKKGNPKLFASGVLLKVGNKHFLVSAAHVFDESDNENTIYSYFSSAGKLVPLEGKVHKTVYKNSRKDDLLDVGFMEVPGSVPAPFRFLDVSEVECGYTLQRVSMLGVQGYPHTKNKKIAYKLTGNVLRAKLLHHTAKCGGDEAYGAVGTGKEMNILLVYDRKRSLDKDHTQQIASHPEGMSGGPIWLNYDLETKAERKLLGIGIEYREEMNIIVGTRIEVVLGMIATVYPELEGSMPQLPSYVKPDYWG